MTRVGNSDISDAPIEPDKPATLVVVFDDGTRRRLTITTAEAATLRDKGMNQTTWWRRARALVNTNAKKLLLWVGALYVASLAVPAATKQLADRQGATAVKAGMIREISGGSAEAFAESKLILETIPDELPRRRLETRKAWEVTQGGIDAMYAIYFDDSRHPARQAWGDYRRAIYAYLSMVCCDKRFIDGDVDLVRAYVAGRESRPFEGSRDPWTILLCGDDRRCASASAFAEAHKWVGLALLARRETVLDQLRGAKPDGFSDGWGDFVDDSFPLG